MFIIHRLSFIVFFSGLAVSAAAGNLDAPAAPTNAASAMYTFQDLYNRLDTGAAGAKRAGPFAGPAAGPTAGTMRTLNEIMAKMPATNANAAGQEEVARGKAYWGLATNAWGGVTGAMPARALSAATNTMPAGYYEATDLTAVDPDLSIVNIRGGVNIFGVAGLPEVADTSSGNAAAGEMRSGKKAWAAGAEITGTAAAGGSVTGAVGALVIAIPDGMYTGSKTATAADTNLAGGNIATNMAIFGVTGTFNTNMQARTGKTGQTISYAPYDNGWWSSNVGVAWPSPRFTLQADTNFVVDNLTGWMWMRDANMAGVDKNWAAAVAYCYGLTNGGYYDWRLPNIRELRSLMDLRVTGSSAKLPSGHPFVNVQYYYWTSTTYAGNTNQAWCVVISEYTDMQLDNLPTKTGWYYVWPVRGGQ